MSLFAGAVVLTLAAAITEPCRIPRCFASQLPFVRGQKDRRAVAQIADVLNASPAAPLLGEVEGEPLDRQLVGRRRRGAGAGLGGPTTAAAGEVRRGAGAGRGGATTAAGGTGAARKEASTDSANSHRKSYEPLQQQQPQQQQQQQPQ